MDSGFSPSFQSLSPTPDFPYIITIVWSFKKAISWPFCYLSVSWQVSYFFRWFSPVMHVSHYCDVIHHELHLISQADFSVLPLNFQKCDLNKSLLFTKHLTSGIVLQQWRTSIQSLNCCFGRKVQHQRNRVSWKTEIWLLHLKPLRSSPRLL